MLTKIALVVPGDVSGGVRTITHKLYKGLRYEGFNVKMITLRGNNFIINVSSDILSSVSVKEYNAVIYMGSVPWPSHLLSRKAMLFLHGFVKEELSNTILYEKNLRYRFGALIALTYWDTIRALNSINSFICHSITACEANKILKNYILLPQFILPDEAEFYEELKKNKKPRNTAKDIVSILTYRSFAKSPRLLEDKHIISLIRGVSKRVNKNIKLTIIDPKMRKESIVNMGKLTIRYTGFLPRSLFLRQIMESDLYLERCVDEELRLSTIEAGLLGIPVAKITYRNYVSRQDYGEDEIIVAKTPKEFIDKLAEYVDYIEYYKENYSRNIRKFILTKRTWDTVKRGLMKRLTAQI